jgi:hypothetical protein
LEALDMPVHERNHERGIQQVEMPAELLF